jgi:hypothetical protein
MVAGTENQAADGGPLSTLLSGSSQVRCVVVIVCGNNYSFVNLIGLYLV